MTNFDEPLSDYYDKHTKGNDLVAPYHKPSKDVLIRQLVDLYDDYQAQAGFYTIQLNGHDVKVPNDITFDGRISNLRGQL